MSRSLNTFDNGVKCNLTRRVAQDYGAKMSPPPAPKPPMDPVRLGIAQRLKTARVAKGLTQQEVADKFGVTKGTVSAWETGAGSPDALRLRSLARLYDVSADAILWDDSLTPDALKFAAQFDALTDKQRRSFRVMWMAFFEDALSDDGVEAMMPITKDRRSAIHFREDVLIDHPHRRKTDPK